MHNSFKHKVGGVNQSKRVKGWAKQRITVAGAKLEEGWVEVFPALFQNWGNCPDFGGKCTDCIHL